MVLFLFVRYLNVPDEWTQPEPQSYKDVVSIFVCFSDLISSRAQKCVRLKKYGILFPCPQGNVYYWLLDPDCFDQYSIIYDGGEKTAIYLNSMPEPTLLEERSVSDCFFF